MIFWVGDLWRVKRGNFRGGESGFMLVSYDGVGWDVEKGGYLGKPIRVQLPLPFKFVCNVSIRKGIDGDGEGRGSKVWW